MKKQNQAIRTEKISISLTSDMTAWLRRCAAKKRSNVSQVIREMLSPAFETRHAK